jgi:hypothetical protein
MRPLLPDDIATHYRPLTASEVRAESYGRLTAARFDNVAHYRPGDRGTFDDQANFGTKCDYSCACTKYVGRQYDGIICDLCGVKVTTSDVRRTRCAHINLPLPIPHPLGGGDAPLNALPVLPIAFIEAPGGPDLLRAYDRILRGEDERSLTDAFQALLERLAPLLVIAHTWNLDQRPLIAHGMALQDANPDQSNWSYRPLRI